MPSAFWALRAAIRSMLGDHCSKCDAVDGFLDIHHVQHDGTAWRARWGLQGNDPARWSPTQAIAYYMDILLGIVLGYKEVILLCRACHEKHHRAQGYAEK